MPIPPGYSERLPTPATARHVERLWSFLPTTDGTNLVLPDGRSDLIIRFRLAPDSHVISATPIITGPATRPYPVPFQAGDGWVGLRLRPELSRALWHRQTGPIADQIARDDAAVRLLPMLSGALHDARHISDLWAALQQVSHWLSGRARPGPAAQALRLFHLAGGRLSIRAAAKHLSCSPRHLHRVFLATVGLAPKTYASIVQFHRALALLSVGNIAASDVAFEAGYADQPHMVRAFRRFGGFSPARLPKNLPLPELSSGAPMSDLFKT